MKNVFRIYIPFLLYLATNSIIRILLPKRESVLLRHLWVLLPWLRPTAEDMSAFGLTWDQALFSFRFENYIPVGKAKRKERPISAVAVRENVWEPLKLGLISGYRRPTSEIPAARQKNSWYRG